MPVKAHPSAEVAEVLSGWGRCHWLGTCIQAGAHGIVWYSIVWYGMVS